MIKYTTARAIPDTVSAALLILSRDRIKSSAEDRVRQICNEVQDWPLLINIANRKVSIPFVYRNLLSLYPDGGIEDVLETMQPEAMQQQMATLRIMSAQMDFHLNCVLPSKVDYLYLKGPALAATFHDDPGLRHSRDVDILVREPAVDRLVEAAMDQGYKVVSDPAPRKIVTSAQDVRAVVRYSPVVLMMSPDGVPVELHKEIDKSIGVFSNDLLFSTASTVTLGGVQVRALHPEVMFCYACYHNSRHLWSRLNWLADLSAMLRHPDLDIDKIRARADDMGLGPTVEACIELDQLARSGDIGGVKDARSHGAQLLQLCVQNFEGGLALERSLRLNMHTQAIPFPWMIRQDVYRRAKLRLLARRFAPSIDQYRSWPLPDILQWLYYPTKPLFSLTKRIQRHLG